MRFVFVFLYLGWVLSANAREAPKGKHTKRAPAQQAKVTRGEPPRPLMMKLQVEQSPQDLESLVLMDSGVQGCLSESVTLKKTAFKVVLSGRIDADGSATSVQGEGRDRSANTCLAEALMHMKFALGGAGPFRLVILRAGATTEPGKLFPLHPKEPKKFE